MPTVTRFKHIIGSPSHSNQTRKKKKKRNPKGEVKLSLFKDDVMLYKENPEDVTKSLLELINEFSNIAGYKVNIQRSVAFLYADNKLSEKLRKSIYNCIKKNKISRSKSN